MLPKDRVQGVGVGPYALLLRQVGINPRPKLRNGGWEVFIKQGTAQKWSKTSSSQQVVGDGSLGATVAWANQHMRSLKAKADEISKNSDGDATDEGEPQAIDVQDSVGEPGGNLQDDYDNADYGGELVVNSDHTVEEDENESDSILEDHEEPEPEATGTKRRRISCKGAGTTDPH